MLKPVTIYTWEIDPAVTPVKLSPTIRLDPRSNPVNGTAIANAIDTAVRAQKIARPGEPVALRPWFEWRAGSGPYPFDDSTGAEHWLVTPPFNQQIQTVSHVAFWSDFNARIIVLQTPFDYIAQDLEKGSGYFNVPGVARQTWLTPVTIDNEDNPYPFTPNPFVGVAVWNQSLLTSDDYKVVHEQWHAEERSRVSRPMLLPAIRQLKGTAAAAAYAQRYPLEAIPEGFEILPVANYKDDKQGFTITQDSSNRPRRLPYAQTRLAGVSAPVLYLDDRRDFPLLAADASYTTSKAILGRNRWLKFARILNTLHSACAAVPGDVHPWIAPPGYGRNGPDTWGNAANLPFETMFTRALWEHCFAAGVDTYIYWNPVNNYALSAVADAWADAYFTGREVLPLRRNLTEITLPTETVTTGSKTTNFADLFQITTFYWRRDPNLALANSRGFGTLADPYIIGAGSDGDADLTAMLASIALTQDTTPTAREAASNRSRVRMRSR